MKLMNCVDKQAEDYQCCRCGSFNVRVDKNPLAWFGGLCESGKPNIEIYCYDCTVSYCESFVGSKEIFE